ncbi:MAG TPA: tRNA pseudouridine(55) synthase TruB [Nevskiales bacterium]|nr:tRNA pseudouridine(55) synthase TruB [Nevskiales bacterium]
MPGPARKGRPVDGILLLDKPAGLSSNAALQRARHLFNAQKAGHTGSLDPLATGLLPVCFGEATKASAYLLDADKRYRVTVRLGRQTTTGDAEGDVLRELPVPVLECARIEHSLRRFTGQIRQVPPMHSALKHQGRRLYELARAGQSVERAPRCVYVHQIRLLGVEKDLIDLEVHCSKGTYVRVLAEDLAADLGTCGHVERLRRLAVGPFRGEDMLGFERLQQLAAEGPETLDRVLLPVVAAFTGWPSAELDADSAWYLQRGQPVQVARAPRQGLLCLYGPGRRLLGVGEVLEDGRIAPRRLLRQPPG